jgi:SAM-dependent methyltransferase
MERAWPEWIRRRDRDIRARLARGDEDSVVYLWLYGTSFTKEPPLALRNTQRIGADDLARLAQRRLNDLVTGLASPGDNDRLQFARDVVERQGIDVSTATGQTAARAYLDRIHERVLREHAEQTNVIESLDRLDAAKALAAYATLFRERGLSSDTSLLPGFALEEALEGIRTQGVLARGSVRRVAIVGPGLDFANKDEGYDFYPPQTIQPFLLMDSLIALGLAAPAGIEMTTFDPSPRVNRHIEAARAAARAGESYVLHLPLPADPAWNRDLEAFWSRAGNRLATELRSAPSPPGGATVRTRAVRVPPARVLALIPHDVNIVVERLEPLIRDEQFDLIVATNVLVYYDTFEQVLALANIGEMLRDGGVFLSNTPVPPIPSMTLSDRVTTVTYSPRLRDHLFRYRRVPRAP